MENLTPEEENIKLKKKIAEFEETLVNYKIAHRRGKNSALDNATKEFHRGSFIATAYILNLLKRRFKL